MFEDRPHALSPFLADRNVGGYRFRLRADFSVDLAKGFRGTHRFTHEGRCWATLEGDTLTIAAGYAWDGCSPALPVLGRWVGTPTPAGTQAASLVHDFLYQFLEVPCAPWDKMEADDLFYDLMRRGGWWLAGTYHGAVAIFGSLFRRLSPGNPGCGCAHHSPPTFPTP